MACGCESEPPHIANAVRWGRVVDVWWPKAAPFPPALPWLGGVISRREALAFIKANPAQLPSLPTDRPTPVELGDALVALGRRIHMTTDATGGVRLYAGTASCRAGGKNPGSSPQRLTDEECEDQCRSEAYERCVDFGGPIDSHFAPETGECVFLCHDDYFEGYASSGRIPCN